MMQERMMRSVTGATAMLRSTLSYSVTIAQTIDKEVVFFGSIEVLIRIHIFTLKTTKGHKKA